MHQTHKQCATAKKGLLAKELDEDYVVKIYIPFLTIDSAVSKLIMHGHNRVQEASQRTQDRREELCWAKLQSAVCTFHWGGCSKKLLRVSI